MTLAILQATAVSTLALTMTAASCNQRNSTAHRWEAYRHRLDNGFSGLQVTGEPQPVLYSRYRGHAVRSEDEGRTWTALARAGPDEPVTSVEVEAQTPYALFTSSRQVRMMSVDLGRSWSPASRRARMRGRVAFRLDGSEVWRTDDHGDTWQVADVILPAKLVTSLSPNPADTRQILASSHFGGFRSTDGGKTWTRLSLTTGLWHVAFVAPFEAPGPLLATVADVIGGGSSFHVSADGGATWTAVDFGPDHSAVLDGLATVTSPPALFVTPAAKRSGDPGLLFRSLDGGRTWQPTTGARGALSGVVRWPGRADTLFAAFADGGIQRSDDGGATWRPIRR